jgi:hypothetical protein
LNSDLVEIKGKQRIAVFANTKTGAKTEKHFNFLHVTPP